MLELTDLILDYRNSLQELWNKHFAHDPSRKPAFTFEIDKAFSLIEEGLFEALVMAKSFHTSVSPTPSGYYDMILVHPMFEEGDALCAKAVGQTYEWTEMHVKADACTFKFIELFDWSTEEAMTCEFVRARLTESNNLADYIGYDFLFRTEEVKFYKLER